MSNYDVTLRTEVLIEYASIIHARYLQYMIKYGIAHNDTTNPVTVAAREVFASKDAMLFCDTLEELSEFEARLKMYHKNIEELEEADKCEQKQSG
jgi:hypothetical protein